MPKILVSNLPVTTSINATVWYEDGPAETENARIAEAAKAGRWERAHGEHAEDYEDLTLELNEQVLAYPLWSFDVVSEGPATPVTPGSRDSLPTRDQFDEAWGGTAHLLRHGHEATVELGERSLGREGAWQELVRLHKAGPGEEERYEYLLEVLGLDVGEV